MDERAVAKYRPCALPASGRGSFLPALRVAEHDPEDAAAAAARFVQQDGAIQLAQFTRDEQPESRAALGTREEGLEDPIDRMGFDPSSVIRDLEVRPIAGVEPIQIDLHADALTSLAVFHGVVA